MRLLITLLACLTALPTASAAPPDAAGAKESLVDPHGHRIRQQKGFRLQLGYGFGFLRDTIQARHAQQHLLVLRPQLRLDRQWSIATTLCYGILKNPLGGMRWAITIEPTFHFLRLFSVSLGLGYGGLAASLPWNQQRQLDEEQLLSSYGDVRDSFPFDAPANYPTRSCDGGGALGLVRFTAEPIRGELFSSGPFIQVSAQWTDCRVSQTYLIDGETGRPAVVRQKWNHLAASLGWLFTWL